MASPIQKAILREVAAVYRLGALRELTDGQLLERFARDRGAGSDHAFAALVERHGPLVLRVCRGVLTDPNDAHDAFQATFLVLVLKARSLWVRDSLGPWLHHVALRTARAARTAALRRRRLERTAAERRPTWAEHEPTDESAHILHAEIARLPERFRVPLILCDLEGQSLEQAARHLGVPVGTIKSRLARGRTRLRHRLERRGHGPNHNGPPAAVPAPLALATLRAADLLATAGPTALAPTLRHLVTGGILAMSLTRWAKLAATAAVFLTPLSGAGLLALARTELRGDDPPKPQAKAAARGDTPVAVATVGTFGRTISQGGTLESANPGYGINPLPGQTTILSILPEGTRVTKGQVVAQLDTSEVRDEVAVQRGLVQTAERVRADAELTLKLAEMAVEEYDKGLGPARRNALAADAALAQKALRAAEDRETRTRAMVEKMAQSVAQLPAPRTPESLLAELEVRNRLDDSILAVARSKAAVDRAGQDRKVFDQFSHPKTLADLQAGRDRAAEAVVARRVPVEAAKARVGELEERIASATLRAPNDGIVVYANDPSARSGTPPIEEGATVRERQIIFRVDDLSRMVVNAKVHEAWVDQFKVGQAATVVVDTYPDRTYRGTVKAIAPLPDPGPWLASAPKLYSTRIELDRTDPDLRPGMVARSDVVVRHIPDALLVPAGTVLMADGRARVGLRQPDGTFRLHDIAIRLADESTAVVASGLKAGDEIHLHPDELLGPEERQRIEASRDLRRREPARKSGARPSGPG